MTANNLLRSKMRVKLTKIYFTKRKMMRRMIMKIKIPSRKKTRMSTTNLKLQCLKKQRMKNQKRRRKKTRKRRRHLVMISLISNLLLIYPKTQASTLMGTLNLSITSRKKWTRLMMWLLRLYHLVLTTLIISNMMLLMMKILIHLGRSLVRASMKMKIQVRMKECQIIRSEDTIQSMSVKFFLTDMSLSKNWDRAIFPLFG